MKIIVFSDSHSDPSKMLDILLINKDIDCVFFLGDGTRDIDTVQSAFLDKKFFIVSGNCDILSPYPYFDIANIDGKKIFYTHGHTFCVKNSLSLLKQKAAEINADIVLFGHTHIPFCEHFAKTLFLNPGSITKRGTYAVIDTQNLKYEIRED